jgi:hypothetical protein
MTVAAGLACRRGPPGYSRELKLRPPLPLDVSETPQSFGTQPLPGMYSRLPDDGLAHPATTTIAITSQSRQSFDMLQN